MPRKDRGRNSAATTHRNRCSLPLFAFFFLIVTSPHFAHATSLTQADRDALTAMLPRGAESVMRSGDLLKRSSANLLEAAARPPGPTSCSINSMLIEAGAALEQTSAALAKLKPMLLPMEPTGVDALTDKDSPSAAAFARNLRRTMGFRGALDKVTQAAQALESMDPLGPSDPVQKAAEAFAAASAALQAANEQSGIGFHIGQLADALAFLHQAILRYDYAGCSGATRRIGQVMGLIGGSLASDGDLLWQQAATMRLGVVLYADMPAQLPHLSPEHFETALDLYTKGVLDFADSLRDSATIAKAMGARQVADFLEANAVKMEHEAADLARADDILSHATGAGVTPTILAQALHDAGAILLAPGHIESLTICGQTLTDAADLIGQGRMQDVAPILQKGGSAVIDFEDAHPLAEQ